MSSRQRLFSCKKNRLSNRSVQGPIIQYFYTNNPGIRDCPPRKLIFFQFSSFFFFVGAADRPVKHPFSYEQTNRNLPRAAQLQPRKHTAREGAGLEGADSPADRPDIRDLLRRGLGLPGHDGDPRQLPPQGGLQDRGHRAPLGTALGKRYGGLHRQRLHPVRLHASLHTRPHGPGDNGGAGGGHGPGRKRSACHPPQSGGGLGTLPKVWWGVSGK